MSEKTSESETGDEKERLDDLNSQIALWRIEFQERNENISPEDIAAAAFPRIFDEDSHFTSNFTTIHEISVQKKALFNEDSESAIGRLYPRTPIVRSPPGQQGFLNPGSTGHGTPRYRHKSPSNRPHFYHPPLLKDTIQGRDASNSVRKTKSTALPAIINTPWPRNVTASTPELKVDDQAVTIVPLPSDTGRENNQRVYLVRTLCYYNVRLIYMILNCFTLVTGFVYLGAAVALCVHKELALVIVDYRVYVSSVICLFGLSVFLLAIAAVGLCLVQSGTRRTAAHAGCSLVMGAILIALAFVQSAAQLSVEVNAEFQMLSTIPPGIAVIRIWDYLHHAFKCCGVRGYLDWCQKVDINSKIYSSAQDFLGSFTCNLPESCCLNPKFHFSVFRNVNYTSCVDAPTPSNTHRSECLTPILVVVSYIGKMYRVVNFITAFILLLTTTTSMILFSYL